jgi:hypothetical protein
VFPFSEINVMNFDDFHNVINGARGKKNEFIKVAQN